MKTSRAGFRGGWASGHAARAAATWGRPCSDAWSVIFTRQAQPHQVTMHRRTANRDPLSRQPIPQLVERQVGVGRHKATHQLLMRRQRERLLGTFPRSDAAGALPMLDQLDRTALTDREPRRPP